jgi:uncharacterized oxidoreductase
MLSIYMSVERFDTDGQFAHEIKRYIDYFKSSKPAQAGGEVLVPGEPELRARKERLAQGIPLADDAWAAIVDAGEQHGVSPPQIKT